MSSANPTPAPEFDDDDDSDRYAGDDGEGCFHCGGDGWRECDDPLECTQSHRTYNPTGGTFFQECRCPSCGGSGRAEDMTIW